MKQLAKLMLIVFIVVWFSGCCSIPDLPGPVGIPGL